MLEKKNSVRLVAVAVATALAGCSVGRIETYQDRAEGAAAQTTKAMRKIESGKNIDVAHKPVAQHLDNEVYIPVRKVAPNKTARTASDPSLSRQIAVNRTFNSPQEFAERITALTGIPVVLAADVMTTSSMMGTTTAQAGGAAALPPLPSATGSTAQGLAGTALQVTGFPVSLSYSGSLSGLLDIACARSSVSWELRDGQINIYRYISKTLRMRALPGDTSMDASIGTAGNSGGSSSGSSSSGSNSTSTQSQTSQQTSGVNITGLSVWKGIEAAVKAMLSSAGKVVVAPSLGTITVTDTPAIVASIERFIEDQNASLSRQVVVNFRVLSIELTDSDNYGINWDTVYSSLSKYSISVSSAMSAISGAGSVGFSVASDSSSRWAGSEAVIEALSSQGKVTTLRSASMTTLNNQPAPLQVGKSTTYVASSTTTISSGVSSTSMTTGTVNSGFSMTLLPHIMDRNKLMLQYAIDISSLLSMTTVTSGTSVLQTPDLDKRMSLQRVLVGSGDTIVVAGFEQEDASATKSGMADANNPILGGQVTGKRVRTATVILLQPVITEEE